VIQRGGQCLATRLYGAKDGNDEDMNVVGHLAFGIPRVLGSSVRARKIENGVDVIANPVE
jgi:hypothetical protein